MLKEEMKVCRHLKKHLCSGESLEKPSLPLTELAVDQFRQILPEKLDHLDLSAATNIIRRGRVSPCSVVLSMLYAKRLRQQRQQNQELLQSMSSSDVFFISMMMASKYLYDEGVEEEVFNDEWADSINQDVDDVNQMEMDFLQALDWRLFVRPAEFENILMAIERRLALQEGLKRGWFTYSEMDVLLDMDFILNTWWQVGTECTKCVTTITAAYVTSLLSLMGSVALALHMSRQLSLATVALFTLQSSPMVYSASASLSFHDTPVSQNHLTGMPTVMPQEENVSMLVSGPSDVLDDIRHSASKEWFTSRAQIERNARRSPLNSVNPCEASNMDLLRASHCLGCCAGNTEIGCQLVSSDRYHHISSLNSPVTWMWPSTNHDMEHFDHEDGTTLSLCKHSYFQPLELMDLSQTKDCSVRNWFSTLKM